MSRIGGYALRRHRWCALLAAVVVAMSPCVAIAAPSGAEELCTDIKPVLTASGRLYKVLCWTPRDDGFLVVYITARRLDEDVALRAEALDLAQEVLRPNPRFLDYYKTLDIVAIKQKPPRPRALVPTNHVQLEASHIQAILDDIHRRSQTFSVSTAGWARSNVGPLEAIGTARRGKPYYLMVILQGVGRDSQGIASLEISFQMRNPAGKLDPIRSTNKIPRNMLPHVGIGIAFEPSDPSGTYTFEQIEVKDRVAERVVQVNTQKLVLK